MTESTKKNFHHWTFNECDLGYEREFLKKNDKIDPGPCFESHTSDPLRWNPKWNDARNYCGKRSTLAWAIGGDLVIFENKFSLKNYLEIFT